MTYYFSNSDLVTKHWLTCLFKVKKESENCKIPPFYVCSHKNFSPKAT